MGFIREILNVPFYAFAGVMAVLGLCLGILLFWIYSNTVLSYTPAISGLTCCGKEQPLPEIRDEISTLTRGD